MWPIYFSKSVSSISHHIIFLIWPHFNESFYLLWRLDSQHSLMYLSNFFKLPFFIRLQNVSIKSIRLTYCLYSGVVVTTASSMSNLCWLSSFCNTSFTSWSLSCRSLMLFSISTYRKLFSFFNFFFVWIY